VATEESPAAEAQSVRPPDGLRMKLDGTISNPWVFISFLAAFVLGANWIESKRNPRQPLGRYRRNGRMPFVGFWNLFDPTVFTPEAIEHHRRRLRAIPFFILAFAVGWVVLDLLW